MKNKKLIGVFCLCFFVLSAAGCSKRQIANQYSQGGNIICFGDSVTFGYGVDSGQDYPSFLSKLVHIPVINAGIDGDTTIEALKRIDTDVLERNPLIVIVEFGGNDFLRKITKETTVSNMEKIIDKVQSKGAMAAIVDVSAGMLMSEYYSAFLDIARRKGAIFIPHVFSGIITNPKMKSDFLHPNAQGYKLIASKVLRYIAPYLQPGAVKKNPQT